MLERLAFPIVSRASPVDAAGRPAARAPSPFAYFLLAAALLPLALFVFAAHRDWEALVEETRTRAGFSRDAIAEHALRIVKTQEIAVARLRERLGQDPARDAVPLLDEIAAAFPEATAVALVDADGTVRATGGERAAGAFPREAGALASRPDFRSLASGAPIAIGGREGGPDAPFTIVHPRRAADGRFEGAVAIAVSPEAFRTYYREIFPARGAVGLIHREGAILVREPEAPRGPLSLGADSPFFGLVANGDRGIARITAATTTGRMVEIGYAKVGPLPVYAFFAVAQEDLAAAWRDRLARTALYFAPAAALLAALAFFAWRSHVRLEDTVAMRTRALSTALDERELLLREVHHRVKNNMQIISSMIRLQDRVATPPAETLRRIQAMAMVHELVYAATGPVTEIDLAAYAERLCAGIEASGPGGIRFDLDLEPVRIDLERAIPFALVLSEAATNAYRHAYPDGTGRIAVTLKRSGDRGELCVEDRGRGFNPEVDARGGFGLKLIRSLAVQLDATYRLERREGTRFTLVFPLEPAAPPLFASA